MAKPKRYCETELTGDLKGYTCSRDAYAFVTYFRDGVGGKRACAQHLITTMKQVAASANLSGYEALSVTPMGSLAEGIERARDKRVREMETD